LTLGKFGRLAATGYQRTVVRDVALIANQDTPDGRDLYSGPPNHPDP
jgi:hypothetical protein